MKGKAGRGEGHYTTGQKIREGSCLRTDEVFTLQFSLFYPAFLKKLDSCYSVHKGKKIVLTCEVVDPNVQVKWLKNGQEIKPSAKYMLKKHKHTHTQIVVSSHRPISASCKIFA